MIEREIERERVRVKENDIKGELKDFILHRGLEKGKEKERLRWERERDREGRGRETVRERELKKRCKFIS